MTDSESSSYNDKNAPSIQLGFSEPIQVDDEGVSNVAHYSPNWKQWDGGKIGGKPSWINPRDIPKGTPFTCPNCLKRRKSGDETILLQNNDNGSNESSSLLRFIGQIYAPADDDTSNNYAFHRTLYVFCCSHPLCSTASNAHESVLVLRGQMSRDNSFYPNDESSSSSSSRSKSITSWDKHLSSTWNIPLCYLCGLYAKGGLCPLAKKWFCSKTHQKYYHKVYKKKNNVDVVSSVNSSYLNATIYNESELVVEEEPSDDDDNNKNEDDTQTKLAEKINKTSLFGPDEDKDGVKNDNEDMDDELIEQEDLNDMTGLGSSGVSDPVTMDFYSRIGRCGGEVKSQCLRFHRWPDDSSLLGEEGDEKGDGGPLWISSNHGVDDKSKIPNCEYCGAERKFEFQIMPQMINFLLEKNSNEDSGQNAVSYEDLPEQGKQALLIASEIVDKAKEEGNEKSLPKEFTAKQEELVEKYKEKLLKPKETDIHSGASIDWGTIAIYTCTASCGSGDVIDENTGAYRKEFAWRQPPLSSDKN
jgi:pre-rRNA-processing protein TSR4